MGKQAKVRALSQGKSPLPAKPAKTAVKVKHKRSAKAARRTGKDDKPEKTFDADGNLSYRRPPKRQKYRSSTRGEIVHPQFTSENAEDTNLESAADHQTSRRQRQRLAAEQRGVSVAELEREAAYERAPRRWQSAESTGNEEGGERGNDALPIKRADGRVIKQRKRKEKLGNAQQVAGDEASAPPQGAETGVAGPSASVPAAKHHAQEASDSDSSDGSDAEIAEAARLLERRRRLHESKRSIAAVCIAVRENPEGSLPRLAEVERLAADVDTTIARAAMLSLTLVLVDIVPGYRIRELSEAEKRAHVSRDVRKLRDYESSLVSVFRRNVQRLVRAARPWLRAADGSASPELALASTALRCLCKLVTTVPHFNDSERVIKAVVAHAVAPSKVSHEPACEALTSLLTSDPSGEYSLLVVQEVARAVKRRNYTVPEAALRALTNLHLAGDQPLARDRQARMLGATSADDDDIAAGLREADALPDQNKKRRKGTETLHALFLTYFRVLKKAPHSPALPSVLEGLARFSHLINMEFFEDLLSTLRGLLARPSMSLQSRLHCITAAFDALQAQANAWNVDMKTFYNELYRIIGADVGMGVDDDVYTLLVRSLRILLIRHPQSSTERVCGFAKRIASLAMQVPSHVAIALLHVLQLCIRRYPRLKSMLEEEGASMGRYSPEVDDAEHANASAALLWELPLLAQAAHPVLRRLAAQCARGEDLSARLVGLASEKLIAQYTDGQGLFRPAIALPKENPLVKRAAKAAKASRAIFLGGHEGVDAGKLGMDGSCAATPKLRKFCTQTMLWRENAALAARAEKLRDVRAAVARARKLFAKQRRHRRKSAQN